jgi:hypothetical protein
MFLQIVVARGGTGGRLPGVGIVAAVSGRLFGIAVVELPSQFDGESVLFGRGLVRGQGGVVAGVLREEGFQHGVEGSLSGL